MKYILGEKEGILTRSYTEYDHTCVMNKACSCNIHYKL